MGADLANSIVQTGVSFAAYAESREANRLAREAHRLSGEANQINEKQMKQDMELTLLQMKQERDLSDGDEKLFRELNSNLLGELNKIANSIYGVEIAIRKGLDYFFSNVSDCRNINPVTDSNNIKMK